jgi:hypothetical protein
VPKYQAPIDSEKPPRAARGWLVFRFLLVALPIVPFLYEGGLLLYGRWARVFGLRFKVGTPVFDHIGQFVGATRRMFSAIFQYVPWNPDTVLLVGIFSCMACMFLLRGKGTRVQ